MTWAKLIGRPWTDSFDCYELARVVRAELGLDMPEPQVSAKLRKALEGGEEPAPPRGWRRVNTPTLGCVVRMGQAHVGVYMGSERVLHCSRAGGVRIDRLRLLKLLGEDITYWELYHG